MKQVIVIDFFLNIRSFKLPNEIGWKDTEDKSLDTDEKKDMTVNKFEEYREKKAKKLGCFPF